MDSDYRYLASIYEVDIDYWLQAAKQVGIEMKTQINDDKLEIWIPESFDVDIFWKALKKIF